MRDFLSKTGTQIGLVVAIMCLSLFALLNFIVLKQSESSFVRVIENLNINPNQDGIIQFNTENGEYNILTFDLEGNKRQKPLHQQFLENFQISLLWISIVGVLTSFLIGFLASLIITRPLNKLFTGMRKLKQNNYKFQLQETGTEEFDIVIAEFNNLTEELQRVEDLRKDLISDTSHEIKTPLASLHGQLEGIKDGVLKPTKKRITNLIDQVDRLNNVVERLQEFSRLRNKIYTIDKREVKLFDVVQEIVNHNEELLSKNEMVFENRLKKNCSILADRNMLSQVITNLLQNAIKYSKAKTIYTEMKKGKIIFGDDGIGIPVNEQKYIFERFYRVEKSRNRATGGLGLGLSIVREIIEAHGWKIEINSGKENGVEFSIEI